MNDLIFSDFGNAMFSNNVQTVQPSTAHVASFHVIMQKHFKETHNVT